MDRKNTNLIQIGYKLKEDIFSNSIEGLLLLKKGTILNKNNIELLIKHQVDPSTVSSPIRKISSVKQDYPSLLEEVKAIFQNILQRDESKIPHFLSYYSRIIDLSLKEITILDSISQPVNQRDAFYQHSINVGILSAIIGKLLGYSKKDWHLLAQMGLFHDIGMLVIEPSLMIGSENLTHQQEKEIQKHTTIGKSILFHISQLDILISRTALLHHEKINGKGYPSHKKENEIPFFIQIVTVADKFTHLCTTKSYFEAINELVDETHDNALNPAIVIPFIQFIMRKLLFQKVQLTNNETAEIIFIHSNEPHLPLIRLQDNQFVDLRKSTDLSIQNLVQEQN